MAARRCGQIDKTINTGNSKTYGLIIAAAGKAGATSIV